MGDGQEVQRERLYRRCIATVTLTGAAWRIIMLISKWNVPLHYGDAWYYSIQAINNAHGRWFKEASGPIQNWGVLPGAEHPPLTSIVVTPVSLLSHPQFWQRATMTLLGVVGIVLISMLARRVGGRSVGVIAAAIAAVYPNIWLSDSLMMSETLVIVMVVFVLIAALRYRDRLDLRRAMLLGVLVGIAGHARSEVLMYSPLFALIGVRSLPLAQWAKRAAVIVAATGITVLPWIVYNTSRFDTVVLMSTNEGNTWLGANCARTFGGVGIGGWNLLCLDNGTTPPAGENTAERSVRRRREAMSYARANATRLPVVVAVRVLRGADLYGPHETVRADLGEERPAWAIWMGIVCWWLLAPLAAIGLWRTRRGVRYILTVPIVGVAVVTIVFYGSHRLRAPVEPLVAVGAAVFLAASAPVRQMADRLLHRFVTSAES